MLFTCIENLTMHRTVLILTIFIGFIGSSQNSYSIHGSVLDEQGIPILVGDVLLLKTTDSTLVKYTSIREGLFLIEDISEGSYVVKISCLGFKEDTQIIEVNKNLSLKIQLEENITNLDEVELIAAKPIVSNSNGNLKIDVTNPVFSSIPDPMELLAKLPSLQVSADRESVSVVGKGVPLIYIGNQRISQEEFNALSVDAIGSVEIIKNPSAKYESDGRAVLLITKKINESEGFRLNILETASFRQNFNNYSSLNGSYKRKKFTFKGNFGYNDLRTWESNQFKFEIPQIDVLTDYLVLIDPNNRTQINTGGGMFYQINETDYFSANATVRLQTDDFVIDTDTFLRQGAQEDNIITKTYNDNTKDFFTGNMNYNKMLNSKTNLFAGIQYSSFVQRLDTEIVNNFNTTTFINSQNRQQKYQIDVLAYRLDFEKTLRNDLKLEIGTNFSDAKASAISNNQFFETETNTNIDYDYKEKNYAGYTQLSGNLTKKIDFSAGMRIEKNQMNGTIETDDIPLVNRKNTNLFPKAMLNFQIDSIKSLTFNYARSIERPSYSRATSISAFINPFLEGAGNVNLRPTFTEEVSANIQFKKSSITINYSKRSNPMFFTIGYEDGAEYAILSLQNLEKESGVDITATIPFKKGIWTSTNTATLSKRRIDDVNAIDISTKPYMYLYTDHQFRLGKNTTLSFGGWAMTRRTQGIFERNAMVVWNATLNKTFFDRLNCSLRFNDITKAMNFEERYTINGVTADGTYFADAQEVAFSIKYAFGNGKGTNYKNKDVDENLGRIQ